MTIGITEERLKEIKTVAVIGDEDSVTGFLLAGIGERNVKGEQTIL